MLAAFAWRIWPLNMIFIVPRLLWHRVSDLRFHLTDFHLVASCNKKDAIQHPYGIIKEWIRVGEISDYWKTSPFMFRKGYNSDNHGIGNIAIAGDGLQACRSVLVAILSETRVLWHLTFASLRPVLQYVRSAEDLFYSIGRPLRSIPIQIFTTKFSECGWWHVSQPAWCVVGLFLCSPEVALQSVGVFFFSRRRLISYTCMHGAYNAI
jgi:hypothetical protein